MGDTTWTGGSSPLATFRCFLRSCPHFHVLDTSLFEVPNVSPRISAIYWCSKMIRDPRENGDPIKDALLIRVRTDEGEDVLLDKGRRVVEEGCPYGN